MHPINYQKLLRGQYEVERLPRGFSRESVVPDYAFNVLNQQGLLYRPVIDEHHIQNGAERMKWPDGKPFAVCLTHDVDQISAHSLLPALRRKYIQWTTAISRIEKIIALQGAAYYLFRTARNSLKKDPLFCFERWLEVENAVGAHSTFFFWPGVNAVSKKHRSDCSYSLLDKIVFEQQKCNVSEMMKEMSRRGWEIGLHPSWYSYDDADELKRQKEALEKVVGQEVVSIRQHFLHFDIRVTPRVQSEAGFKYDSTLGFNDNIGFRFGTSYPWRLFDVKTEEELPIIEVPLIIQDGAMLKTSKGMRLDEDMAFQYVRQLAQAVENVGGILTLLWHPDSIANTAWWHLYLRTLEYLKEKNVWFGSIKEILTYFSNHALHSL